MDNNPTPHHRRPRRAALGGVVIGALAVVVSLLAFTAGATAQDGQPPALSGTTADIETDVDAEADVDEYEEDGYDDFDDFDDAFEAFDSCLEENLGIGEDAGDDAWDAISDDQWTTAESACEEYLPEEIRELEEAFEEFDACLVEQGIDLDEEFEELGDGPVVFVEGESTETMASFGDGDGSITITKTGDDVAVATAGDVEVIEVDFEAMEEAFDEAHEACEELLPEDGEFFFEDEFDEFEPVED